MENNEVVKDTGKQYKDFFISNDLFITALKTTFPVFLGYIPLGMAFGFLFTGAGYHWSYAFLMSLLVYAGSGQFLAVGLLAAGAGLGEFVIATLLLNLRHAFYGLSLLDKFADVGKVKPYLIFALTDETYALLTTTEIPAGSSKSRFYFYIAALDHFYWILGSVLGAILGSLLNLNLQGMSFVLTALFVVLTIEQYFSSKASFPFMAAGFAGIFSLVLFSPDNMLLISILLGTLILMGWEKLVQNEQLAQKKPSLSGGIRQIKKKGKIGQVRHIAQMEQINEISMMRQIYTALKAALYSVKENNIQKENTQEESQ